MLLKSVATKPIEKWHNLRHSLLNYKITKFDPKVKFEDKVSKYIIKTAQTEDEIREVLELRHLVFIEEGLGEQRFGGVDFDKFDLLGDHILVKDTSTNVTIGTYRMMCSLFTDEFYSETEFHMSEFFDTFGTKLELGRACIHPDYRTGASINLVWKGLGRYSNLVDARFMFGCSSVKTTNKIIAEAITEFYRAQGRIAPWDITARRKFQFKPKDSRFEPFDMNDMSSHVPSLMQSYIAAGAMIGAQGAYDREFRCTDFLTLLDMNTIAEKYRKRYL
tara:strand:+ start:165081 stop:165908 length:828 start_codon:yes stop_codon:yes gene_type:complete